MRGVRSNLGYSACRRARALEIIRLVPSSSAKGLAWLMQVFKKGVGY
jgi:hypothetical protein